MTCAIVFPGSFVPGAALGDLLRVLNKDISTVSVRTCFDGRAGPERFDEIALVATGAEELTVETISAALKLTNANGRLTCVQPSAPASQLKLRIMLSGTVVSKHESLSLAGVACDMFLGERPQFAVGAKASIAVPGPAKPAAAPVWKLDASKVDDDDDMIDEDELLTEEDRQPAPRPAAGDCEVGVGKKACKNCSCGRAEAEAAGEPVKLTTEMINNPQSACGSCGLGDAFRCAGCPYRGLPAFEQGKKIQLGSDYLVADA